MKDFQVTVRLDTPLLQSGAEAKSIDPAKALRGPSMRGLLHTFARALIGPLVGSDPELTKRAEYLLLGAAGGGDDGSPPTYRISDTTEELLGLRGEIPNCPHDPRKGSRNGHPEGSKRILLFSPRPWVFTGYGSGRERVEPIAQFREALWAVVWTAFSLGGLGNRSRRGYGSLTIVDGPEPGGLPVFSTPSSVEELQQSLSTGFTTAQQIMLQWLNANSAHLHHVARLPGAPAPAWDFFEVGSPDQIHVGTSRGSSQEVMAEVMQRCHEQKDSNNRDYEQCIGNARTPRLASPLWIRVYRVTDGYAPVFTYSARDKGDPRITDAGKALAAAIQTTYDAS